MRSFKFSSWLEKGNIVRFHRSTNEKDVYYNRPRHDKIKDASGVVSPYMRIIQFFIQHKLYFDGIRFLYIEINKLAIFSRKKTYF